MITMVSRKGRAIARAKRDKITTAVLSSKKITHDKIVGGESDDQMKVMTR
jgi:hypothetical protein